MAKAMQWIAIRVHLAGDASQLTNLGDENLTVSETPCDEVRDIRLGVRPRPTGYAAASRYIDAIAVTSSNLARRI
jgi:hypothetical protein